LNASDDPKHPPDANGWENPVHEAPAKRNGSWHGRYRRRRVPMSEREAEEYAEARADHEQWEHDLEHPGGLY
jgi:hypothetical protein